MDVKNLFTEDAVIINKTHFAVYAVENNHTKNIANCMGCVFLETRDKGTEQERMIFKIEEDE